MTHYDNDLSLEITRTIAEIADTNVAEIVPCQAISDLPNWDSLKQIMLLAAIERALDIRLPMEAFLAIHHLEELHELVRNEVEQS